MTGSALSSSSYLQSIDTTKLFAFFERFTQSWAAG
jgi:hypothetical protein